MIDFPTRQHAWLVNGDAATGARAAMYRIADDTWLMERQPIAVGRHPYATIMCGCAQSTLRATNKISRTERSHVLVIYRGTFNCPCSQHLGTMSWVVVR